MTSTARQPTRISIDRISADDLEAVAFLDAAAFLTPWHIDSFREALTRSYAIFLALRSDDSLVGYSLSWLVADEMHILKFAVDDAFRGLGFGTQLLGESLKEARAKGASIAWLEVRPSNREALALYEGRGFERAYQRRNYYSDTGEDAIILLCKLKKEE